MYLLLVISLVATLASPSRSSHTEMTSSHQFEKELNLLKEKVENLEGGKNELSSLKIQVESLEKGESILKMKVESLEKSETDLKKKVEHLEKGKTELIMKIEKLEKNENDLKKKIEDMETSESFSNPKIENYEERKREESKKNNAFSKAEVMKRDKTEPVNTQDKIDTKEEQDYTAEEIDAGKTHRAGNNTEDRLAYLEELSKLNLRRSCHELAKYGVNVNSYYYVDPDGILVGAAPIRVWCEFSNGFAVTEVLHNSEEKIDVEHCHDPGCYVRPIVYSAPDFQIQSLIKISEKCEQSIEYNCLMAPLWKNGVDLGFWLDKNGEAQVYWDGANGGQHVCECYFSEGGCLDQQITNNTCNCDAGVPELKSDVGVIRNISALPVSQLQFGDLTYQIQQASHQLGRLRCWGEAEFDAGTSCAAIKKAGEFRRGYFNVKATEEENSKLVFCEASPGYEENSEDEVFIESSEDHFQSVESIITEMETEITDHFQSVESTISGIKVDITEMATELTDVGVQVSILQDDVENLLIRSDYCAYQYSWAVSSGSTVTYEKLLVENNHNAPRSTLNIHTGEFKAGMSGLYKVDVSMRMEYAGGADCDVYIARNGAHISESRMITTSTSGTYEMAGRSMMVQLNSGDTLSIQNADKDSLYQLIFCVMLTK